MFRLAFWAALELLLVLVVVGKTTSHLSSGPHIADVNILLPPKMTNPVEYRLQGSDGCFKWYFQYTHTHNYWEPLPSCFWLICRIVIIFAVTKNVEEKLKLKIEILNSI